MIQKIFEMHTATRCVFTGSKDRWYAESSMSGSIFVIVLQGIAMKSAFGQM